MDDYLEASQNNTSYLNGMDITFGDPESVRLCGNKYTRVVATNEYLGKRMTQVFYYRKIGVYMICITVTITDGYDIDDIEDMFF